MNIVFDIVLEAIQKGKLTQQEGQDEIITMFLAVRIYIFIFKLGIEYNV